LNAPKFSVITIGRNEEKTLPRLLDSLAEFFGRGGEMIFVDTGSTDKTAEVARKGGAKVFEVGDRFRTVIDKATATAINNKFVVAPDPPIVKAGDPFFSFADARNYAMDLASNDFLCTPDCDEAWTVLNIDKINELIEAGWEKLFVNFVFSHFPDGSPSVKFSADTRFYDRRKIKWKGIIHETMQGNAKMMAVGEDVAYLEHYQNQETDRSRYLSGLGWACHLEPDNDRNSHYFARELMYRTYYKSAIKEFRRHIDMNRWDLERGQSMIFLGNCYAATGEEDEALEWWHKAIGSGGPRREAFLSLAHWYQQKNNPRLVAAYTAAALEIPNNGFYANDVSNYTFTPHEYLYWAKGWVGDIAEARTRLLKCLEYQPTNQKYIHDMIYYFRQPKVSIVIPSLGREDKLKRCLDAIKENAGYDNYEIIVEYDSLDDRQGAPKTLKKGVEKSTGELVAFIGNDCIPRKNFLINAIIAMHRHFPDLDGLIGFNDCYWKGEFATHWLASKRLLPYLGGEFFHTGYYHVACDNELTERVKQLGKYHWEESAVIYHDHPGIHGAGNWEKGWDQDPGYKYAYSREVIEHDRALIEKRGRELGFPVIKSYAVDAKYPEVSPLIDLRKKIKPYGKKVLNVGVGPDGGNSAIASQLPFFSFKQLDHIDVYKPYLDEAQKKAWNAERVNFIHGDITEYDKINDYDLILMFDVLEHLPKEKGLKLLDSKPRKLIFLPLENGKMRENTFGVSSQDHISSWTEKDFIDRGFAIQPLKQFNHGDFTSDVLWATDELQ